MDDAIPSGLPNPDEEAPPLGVPEAAPEGDGAPARGEDAMPGIPSDGEPPADG